MRIGQSPGAEAPPEVDRFKSQMIVSDVGALKKHTVRELQEVQSPQGWAGSCKHLLLHPHNACTCNAKLAAQLVPALSSLSASLPALLPDLLVCCGEGVFALETC